MRNTAYDNLKIVGGNSLKAQSFTGSSAVEGAAVDTKEGDNALIYVSAAQASGTPTAASLVVKVQESADGSTSWADALDNTGTAIGFSLTGLDAAAKEGVARIEGLNLNRKRYLRAVITPAFTGGTTPAILAFAQIVVANSQRLPTNTGVSNT